MALTAILVLVVLANGLPVFWPHKVAQFQRLLAVWDADGTLTGRVERELAELKEELDASREPLEKIEDDLLPDILQIVRDKPGLSNQLS